MRKTKFLVLTILAVVLMLPVSSFADSATSSNNRETIKNEIENKKEALKQEMEQKKEAVKNSVGEIRQNATDKITERVNQFVEKMIERFNAATNRLDLLVKRIESRITKIESKNIDESKAKELLATAKIKIEAAKSSISLVTFQTNITSAAASTTASTTAAAIKNAFKITKTQIEKAKQDLKDAHAALIDVVNSLKPGDNKLKSSSSTASSSAATTTETD